MGRMDDPNWIDWYEPRHLGNGQAQNLEAIERRRWTLVANLVVPSAESPSGWKTQPVWRDDTPPFPSPPTNPSQFGLSRPQPTLPNPNVGIKTGH